jgi:hypothetical protein
MPTTTYISVDEYEALTKVSDEEVNELFQEVRNISNRILVKEILINTVYRHNRTESEYRYILYKDLEFGEVQIINFEAGLNIDKNTLTAFLYGFLAGKKYDK